MEKITSLFTLLKTHNKDFFGGILNRANVHFGRQKDNAAFVTTLIEDVKKVNHLAFWFDLLTWKLCNVITHLQSDTFSLSLNALHRLLLHSWRFNPSTFWSCCHIKTTRASGGRILQSKKTPRNVRHFPLTHLHLSNTHKHTLHISMRWGMSWVLVSLQWDCNWRTSP